MPQELKNRYSDAELEEFKTLIKEKSKSKTTTGVD